MRKAMVAAVVGILLASFAVGVGEDEGAVPDAAGSVALFCRIWPDARGVLLESWNGEAEPDDAENWARRLDNEIARYARIVPAEIRTEWDSVHRLFTRISDLRYTVGYDDGNIRPEHLVMVFGDAGPEAAVADGEVAIAAIDEWATTACGDFRSRWCELERAVRFELGFGPGEVEHVRLNIDTWEASIAVGDRLVPNEIAGEWRTAAGIQARYFAMLRSGGFTFDFADPAEEEAAFFESVGMARGDAWDASNQALEAISEWINVSCGAMAQVAGGSGPGRLSVRLRPDPAIAYSTLLLALLPAGVDFGSVGSINDYLAGTCPEVGGFEEFGDPPEFTGVEVVERLQAGEELRDIAAGFGLDLHMFLSQWDFEQFGLGVEELEVELDSGSSLREVAEELGLDPLELLGSPFVSEAPDWALQALRPIDGDTEYSDDVCQFRWEEEAILDPGDYELFVGAYRGRPGDWRFFVAAPEACTQISVTVAGDTTIELPALEPCVLEPLGNPQEIARRSRSPVAGDDTLRVRLQDAFADDSPYGCGFLMALLPSGTTLNDVGRGEVWPSGGVRFDLPPGRDFDPEMAARAGVVPILAYPPTEGLQGLFPYFREDGTWDGAFPDPVALKAGAYDLRIERFCLQQPDDDVDALFGCARVTVDVRGDTIVDLPDLGECP